MVWIAAAGEMSPANYAPKNSGLLGGRVNPSVPVGSEDRAEIDGDVACIYLAIHKLRWLANVYQIILASTLAARSSKTDKDVAVEVMDSRQRFRGRHYKAK
jgi:hypothetical protein